MQPILARRSWLALYLAAWIPIAAVPLVAVFVTGPGRVRPDAAVALVVPMTLLYAFACLASWYVCRAVPVGESSPMSVLVTQSAAAIVTSSVWTFAGSGIAAVLERVPVYAGIRDAYARQAPLLFLAGVLLFLLAVSVHYLVIALQNSRDVATRALRLQVLAREAELRALRAQVDPHFLFNSLNSISALTTADPQGARRMCLRLAEFLRDTLRVGGRAEITLGEELAFARRYLDIEKVRLGDRLHIVEQVAPDALDCTIAPLLLQPIVENAVTHGIAHLTDGGTVTIAARRDGARLEIAVENPCDPEHRGNRTNGMGLTNVRQRLDTLFGRDASLHTTQHGGTFRAELQVPLREG